MSEPEARPSKWALTTRLVLGFSLAALITLTAMGAHLSHRLRKSFELEDTELLADHVAEIRRAIATSRPGDLHEAKEIIVEHAGAMKFEKYYGRLEDPEGHVLLETPGYAATAPDIVKFPSPAAINQELKSIATSSSPSGTPLFLTAAWIAGEPSQPPMRYLLAFDASHVEQWLRYFNLSVALAIGVGTLASALLGWLTTRRGLQPLRDITSAVQGVSATELHARLGGQTWPKELATLAREFDGMSHRLQESFERLSQFSADVAHELRTPLSNMLGGTSLLLSKERSGEDYRRALLSNLEELDRMTDMVSRLLFLARADNREAKLTLQEVDCAEESRAVLEFFAALAEEKGVALRQEGQARLRVDVGLFRQALSNLVSNAIRHTPRGGEVLVQVSQESGDGVIAVHDTGEGIAAEHLPHIFDRFYRADDDRASASPRAGLGLALVETVMQLHEGRVSVASQPGQGSEFRLEFLGSPRSPSE